eukprot:CAMPEP_0184692534 /NCGR_PEP_ID=MMETSP0313-20130426/977_1 /TAXON_ID=2792 /ORGANISM="Porphyridium aerugineum, Strain SAG 1380-2" /LENGTH=1312 /DNA_ID=CAMNT_0027150371 /DNA_START=407 /DNA_END=4345 /DNA_ORIENTATION=+
MLTKFETKSNRVKGLSFHPKRPWILSSLHSGSIQLWDYRMGTLIDRFEEHEGPVRGIDFHPTQPLFVSGGDDYKIKIWNYKLRRCLFTLMGHLDYIRTVYFHKESPWIVSASDDQTVRIWNWQNRSCLAVLTGHNHYVMSASFHPSEDLVVSASLDQTIRVWDLSSLRQKSVRAPGPSDMMGQVRGNLPAAVNADLFGSSDATVKYVLEGHARGVNWAQFHPTLPLIISGADDRMIKLWRVSDSKAWEVDTFRGHFNNVSCVMFHPRLELVISDSEDKTIRVWDLNRRTCLHTFRREADRFWILAVHPEINLIAAGHDSGMVVFKLERERPAFSCTAGNLVYVKDRYLRSLDFDNGRDVPLLALSVKSVASLPGGMMGGMDPMSMYGGGVGGGMDGNMYGAGGSNMIGGMANMGNMGGMGGMGGMMGGMIGGMLGASGGTSRRAVSRSMSYNVQEGAVLLNLDEDGGTYELYVLPKTGGSESVVEPRKGSGTCAVFVGRNRFASLEQGKTIVVRDLHNEVTKRIPVLLPGADLMFGAGPGFVLLRNEDRVALQDLQQRKIIAEVSASSIKYVVWSEDMKRVALLGKHVILICSRKLEILATIHETIRVKSAAWDDSGVLLYTTLNHLKYCLPNGDSGVVSTLTNVIYITRVRGPAVCYLDREGNPGLMPIDPTEYTFKLLLLRKRYDDVKRMISENRIPGQAIISYLHKKGFPEVALHFVRDEQTRFALAIDSGAIDVALQSAQILDDQEAWKKLADEAMRQGNVEVVEFCLQKTKNLERLAFLYVSLGDFEKLAKMAKIAEASGNYMARFQILMYLGDYDGMSKVLAECGQLPLAKLCAKTHGLTSLAEELPGDDVKAVEGNLLLPPIPVNSGDNWPLLQVSRGMFKRDVTAGEFEEPSVDYYEDAAVFAESEREGGWDDAPSKSSAAAPLVDPFAQELAASRAAGAAGGDGGWGGDDFDIDIPAAPTAAGGAGAGTKAADEDDFGREAEVPEEADRSLYYVPPKAGTSTVARWNRSSKLAGELVATGSFAEAMKLLSRQIGAKSYETMHDSMMAMYLGCRASLPGAINSAPTDMYLSRLDGTDRPTSVFSLGYLKERMNAMNQLVTQGRFSDAHKLLALIYACVPLLIVDTLDEVTEVKNTIAVCKEYATGLLLEMKQKEAKGANDAGRQVLLAALFTHCRLAPLHNQLTLRAAMKVAYDTKNYILASGFARRLLETSPKPDLAAAARKMIQFCDSNMTNANEIDYDDRRDFVVNCQTLSPLYAGQPRTECPFCGSIYSPEGKGSLCGICRIASVGSSAEGLRISASQVR